MASPNSKSFLLLFSIFFSACVAITCSSSAPATLDYRLSSVKDICKSTPYPDVCFESLKISVSINIIPSILNFLLHSLQTALSEAEKLSNIFSSSAGHLNIFETQKGTLQDCSELQQITVSSLQKSASIISSSDSGRLADARAFLSAALTNKVTCLEGLDSASGPSKPALVSSIEDAYKHVSNALSILSKPGGSESNGQMHRRLMEFPSWMSSKDRRILQSFEDDGYHAPSNMITVAANGTGNFTSITDAIRFAPNNSADRIFIFVRHGVYKENVEIPSWKRNIVLLGDGSDVTIITGNRSVGDGWTTFRSATVAVSGERFLARGITFENSAGPEKHQAVALRVSADFCAFYRCTMKGHQDTLYVHSFRQFYRECDVYGTIDYIFGNAAVVFQGCNVISRLPMPGQMTVITAQSRDVQEESTGISLQNCSILPTNDLYSSLATVKSYLGRPWRNYSTTVIIKSYIDQHIAPEGWTTWEDDQGLSTLYYGEYGNDGPGAVTDHRVTWPGFHIMDYNDASNFTVSKLVTGDEWLASTEFPYDNGI